MASPLARWLATLDGAALADILVRRPDAANPPPAHLGELAARLQEVHSVDAVMATLPLPAVQLIEAAQALGGPSVSPAALAAAVGRTAEDPDLAAALHVLAQRALVWPDADGRLRMAGVLWSAFEDPLDLGPPAAQLLQAAPSAEIRDVARRLGVAADRSRGAVVEAVRRWLSDAEAVRAVVAGAPPATRDLLHEMAATGPTIEAPQLFSPVGRRSSPDLMWAVERALLVWDGWQHLRMPYEVGLALRGDGWHAPFDPHPPAAELVDIDAAAVAREAVAAAATALAQVSALLGSCAGTPIGLLKSGGVGVRELRRLGRVAGAGEHPLRLLIEVAHAAGLLAIAGESVLPTSGYDEWLTAEPADRLVPLLDAWRRMTHAPLAPPVLGGPAAPLRTDASGIAAHDLRTHLLRTLGEYPEGSALAGPAAAVPLLRWRAPLLVLAGEAGEAQVGAAWEEAALLGIVAHGALTPLGRALSDPAALRAVAAELLPDSVGEALFQADLTAVVPGAPTAALADLLDAVADRESGGGATTWRFGAASVRRALDGGYAAQELLAQLRKAALGGALPQPLEYLIGDVARRHGSVRIRAVGCVLRAEDPALLAEIAGTRALRSLRLDLLAPTVLASGSSVKDTLAALRAVGFAPMREDADGLTVVERRPMHRAPSPRRSSRPVAGGRAGASGTGASGPGAGAGAGSAAAGGAGAPGGRAAWVGGGEAGGVAGGIAGGGGQAARRAARPRRDPLELAEALLASSGPREQPEPALAPVIMLRPGLSHPSVAANAPTPAQPAGASPAAPGRTAPSRASGHGVRPSEATEAVATHAAHLERVEQARLATAIARGAPVRIVYTDSGGRTSNRVVEPLDLDDNLMIAWCHLRDGERAFALDRIDAVHRP